MKKIKTKIINEYNRYLISSKNSIRKELREDEEFVDECKKCFTFATQSFEDIKDYIEETI